MHVIQCNGRDGLARCRNSVRHFIGDRAIRTHHHCRRDIRIAAQADELRSMDFFIRAKLTAPIRRSDQHGACHAGGDARSGAPDEPIQSENEHGVAHAVAAVLAEDFDLV